MQIPRIIFLGLLEIMKNILDLAQFKMGKESKEFKYFRKKVMDFVFNGCEKIFKQLKDNKLIEKCECGAKLRQGYSNCDFCGGSGYCNKK